MTITDKTKPQADYKGLSNLLGSGKQITAEIIADDETIASLIAQGQGDKLLQFVEPFYISGERVDTAGKVALILSDHLQQPNNIGLYTLNSDDPI